MLTEPAADAVTLQGSAQVVRSHLHPELFAQIAADLLEVAPRCRPLANYGNRIDPLEHFQNESS
jgi:hypothetical protein